MADRDLERWMDEQDFEVTIPEFWPPGYALAECFRIIPEQEAAEIAHAAYLMHHGYPFEAEQHRQRAGYGGLG